MRSAPVLCFVVAAACSETVAPTTTISRQGDQRVDDPRTAVPPPLDAGTCDAHFDPCTPSPCFGGVECTPEGEWDAQCGECPDGMQGDGFHCTYRPLVEISEIDYDQPGADTAEFVELMNVGPHPAPLTGLTLELINGDNGLVYRKVKLDSLGELEPSELAVIAMSSVSVPEDTPFISLGSSAVIQNGPDAARIVDADGEVIDAIAYGGAVDGIAERYHTEVIDPGEGSLVRLEPGGPFVVACEATPGRANVPPCGD
jgi:hypothetical protein